MPSGALAQADDACAPTNRPIFAGHAFDLDATLETTALTTTPAYRDLERQFGQVTALLHAGDDSGRLFLLEQSGEIWVFEDDPDATDVELFLDLSGEIFAGGERGLLGLAFDPEFGDAGSDRFGEFYVYVSVAEQECACEADDSCALAASDREHCSNLLRFRATAENGPFPDTVDPTAAGELLLEIEQPRENHNGGSIVFGPDDLLYVASGDGGLSTGQNQAQDEDSLLGKILRLDVRGQSTYAIPPGNPFFGDASRAQEILHKGLRNPWKITIDRDTGDLWIGDVGNGDWEEIDYWAFGSAAPLNYGWPECEGTHEVGSSTPCDFAHDRPVIEIPRPSSGGAITGGYVYRGSDFPELAGRYVFAELLSREIYAWDRTTTDPATGLGVVEVIANFGLLATLGETADGELLLPQYKFSGTGEIRRFENASEPGDGIPLLLSQTGLFEDTAADPLAASEGLIEYTIETPLWSDDAAKQRWLGLPGEEQITFRPAGAWSLPVGTVIVKHFELPHAELGSQRIETRVLLHQQDDWLGFTYRWNNAQTDASLLKLELVEDVCLDDACSERQTWTYPGPSTCMACHTDASRRVLGLRTEQFNRIDASAENQLRRLNCMQVFDSDIGTPAQYEAFASIDDETASVHKRVRSYLASNCAHCHQPDHVVQANIDLRFATPLSDTGLVLGEPIHELEGLSDPDLLTPGDAVNSVIWHRQHTLDASIRMARLTRLRDEPAVDLQEDWIDGAIVNAPDDDHDGVSDASDNCPSTPNADQSNFDGGPDGDACDPDTVPDLVALSPAPDFFEAALGRALGVTATVGNDGTGPARATQVRFFLSEDTNHDAGSDPWIGDCFIDPLDPDAGDSCRDAQARIPEDLAVLGQGETVERFLGACADALDFEAESSEANNCAVGSTPILVPEADRLALQLAALASLLLLVRWQRRVPVLR